MQFPETFTRHDIQNLLAAEQAEVAASLGVPHFAASLASIAPLQAIRPGGLVRGYLLELLARNSFTIRSPFTGRELRSGGSLLLVDKSVLFSFPDEPEVMLGIGDISMGYPIGALVLTGPALLLPVSDSVWGFAERHLPWAASAIRDTGWRVAPSHGPLCLVVGDTNFAHYAWNQLSALDDLPLAEIHHDVRVVATQQPLGPMHEILPALPPWEVEVLPDTSLQALNRPGLVFTPVGAHLITAALCGKINTFAAQQMTARTRTVSEQLRAASGPVLWLSVRTRNRTAVNQHEMLEALGSAFLDAAAGSRVLIDGYSLAHDLAAYPDYHRNEAAAVLAADTTAAEVLAEALTRHAPGRIEVAVGLTVAESIALARHASFYFCHHGTVQHKVGWFTSTPGVVHCNRAILTDAPAGWVAAQSEVARPPAYLPPDLVQDGDMPDTDMAFAELLRHENYVFMDIPATVAAVLAHAEAAGLLTSSASEHTERPVRRLASRGLLARLLAHIGLKGAP
jgi:hypothetical protein